MRSSRETFVACLPLLQADLLASAGAISALLLLLDRPCSEADSAAQMWSCQALALIAYKSRSLAASMLKADAVSRLLNLLPVSSVQVGFIVSGFWAECSSTDTPCTGPGAGACLQKHTSASMLVAGPGSRSVSACCAHDLGGHLSKHKHDVQAQAAAALAAIAAMADGAGQAMEPAVEALVSVLQLGDPSSWEIAAAALGNIAGSSGSLASQVASLGSVQVLAQMLARTGETDIQGAAASALAHMASGSNVLAAAIMTGGVLQPLIRLLATGSVNARKEACTALGQLAQASRHNRAAIKRSGAILPLMRCMQTDDGAQQAASFALRQLG